VACGSGEEVHVLLGSSHHRRHMSKSEVIWLTTMVYDLKKLFFIDNSKGDRGLVAKYTICAQQVVGSNPKKPIKVVGRASDLNSLLSSNKVSLLTREQTPWPRTGINNVEHKRKQKNLALFPVMVGGNLRLCLVKQSWSQNSGTQGTVRSKSRVAIQWTVPVKMQGTTKSKNAVRNMCGAEF